MKKSTLGLFLIVIVSFANAQRADITILATGRYAHIKSFCPGVPVQEWFQPPRSSWGWVNQAIWSEQRRAINGRLVAQSQIIANSYISINPVFPSLTFFADASLGGYIDAQDTQERLLHAETLDVWMLFRANRSKRASLSVIRTVSGDRAGKRPLTNTPESFVRWKEGNHARRFLETGFEELLLEAGEVYEVLLRLRAGNQAQYGRAYANLAAGRAHLIIEDATVEFDVFFGQMPEFRSPDFTILRSGVGGVDRDP